MKQGSKVFGFLSLLLVTGLLSGCPGQAGSSSESNEQASQYEEQDKDSNVLTDYVRTPLDKAEAVQDLGNSRAEALHGKLSELGEE